MKFTEEPLENGVYSGFRTSGSAENFARKHNVEHFDVFWSQAEQSWVVVVDDQRNNFTQKRTHRSPKGKRRKSYEKDNERNQS